MNISQPSHFAGTILIVDDVAANRDLLRETLEPCGYEILMAPDGETALKAAVRAQPDVILLDVLMPGLDGFATCRRLKQTDATCSIPILFITARDDAAAAVEGFQAGGVDFITRPFQAAEVLARVRAHLQNSRLTRDLQVRNAELHEANERLGREIGRREQAEACLREVDDQLSLISQQEARRWGVEALVGRSAPMVRLVAEVRKLQGLPSTSVLITGESGTGKELVARAIHFGSARGRAPFLAVNCSAVPTELAEALFFGHAKGAFSGATHDQKGYLGNAHGGTLFLDEIGDMPLPLQAKLLRVLEGGVVLPVGASQERRVDVRAVAATNCDLQEAVGTGAFRSELYFRLAHAVLEVPALRDRRGDIPLLTAHFLESLSSEMAMHPPRLSPAAVAALEAYDYPGNVRELKNLLERALIESGGGEVHTEHLHFAFPTRRDGPIPFGSGPPRPPALAVGTTPGTKRHGDEERVLSYVRAHGSINNTLCRELLGVGMNRAWYLLRKLHRSGALRQQHSGRWANYSLP